MNNGGATAPAALGAAGLGHWRADAARIAALAWPLFIGQAAVLLFSTVDTVLLARHSSADLAAFAVGAAAYISVFIGLMGVVVAVGPIAGQLFGAGRPAAAGDQLHQAVWLALALSLPGAALLVFPAPFLWLADATPAMADKVRGYLIALAVSLPASLLFAAYRGFNTAVSRPKAVMALQLGGLALKIPLSALLVFGAGPLPALGVTGCGIATCVAMWAQAIGALAVLARDPFYAPFALKAKGRLLRAPHRASLAALLALGVPMGLAILVEVTGFTFMAFFIARLGGEAVAGHQIAANLAALLFMLPLALGNATGTLVAQRVGAGEAAVARRVGHHGLALAAAVALALGSAVYAGRAPIIGLYTRDAAVAAAALPLVAWVGLFHCFDAQQAVAAFTLRAWRVATLPLAIYAGAVWGIGLGGGYWLATQASPPLAAWLAGASAYWAAGTLGLAVAAVALVALQWAIRPRAG